MFYAGIDMLFSILFPILFLVVLGMILYLSLIHILLADRYDKEQAELTEKIEQYEREGRSEHDQLDKIQDFIDEVSKYAGITELNYKILHQLIDKILVSKAEKVDGEYVQKIQIFYRFIGPLDAIE